jgi:hypothetical protein
MARVSAKEFVKAHVPNAKVEKQVQGRIKGLQKTFWLIRDGNSTMYMAEGDTEAKAWNAAMLKLVNNNIGKQR